MTTNSQLRKIRKDVAKDSLEKHYATDPLLVRVLGQPTVMWNHHRVTITFGDKTFNELTNVTVEKATTYLSGMGMGIACKMDRDHKQFIDELKAEEEKSRHGA